MLQGIASDLRYVRAICRDRDEEDCVLEAGLDSARQCSQRPAAHPRMADHGGGGEPSWVKEHQRSVVAYCRKETCVLQRQTGCLTLGWVMEQDGLRMSVEPTPGAMHQRPGWVSPSVRNRNSASRRRTP